MPSLIAVDDLRSLTRGGTATTFTARHGGHRVLVKVPDARSDVDALAEARILARVDAPPAPHLFGTTHVGGRIGLVLEYIELPTLRAVRHESSPAVAAAICDAVARVHACGVVHADLTPDNILVDPATAVARLVDFGVAAHIGSPLVPLATVGYAAPERLTGSCTAATSVDVYALGVILFELLTGAHPFEGSIGERRMAHAARRTPRLSERVAVSTSLDAIVHAAMAKSPDQRPTATELAAALREAGGERMGAVVAPAPSAPRRQRAILVACTWAIGAVSIRACAEAAAGAVAYTEGDRHVIALWSGDAPQRARALESSLRDQGATEIVVRDADIRIDASNVPRGAAIVNLARTRATESRPSSMQQGVPLVGRDSIVQQIVAMLRGGETSLVTVVGDPGYGKSRLVRDVIDTVRGELDIVEVRAPSIATLLRALPTRWACDDELGDAALRVLSGEIEVSASPAAALEAAPGALRQAAARALASRLARGRGLLVIDDAHAADPVILDALELTTMTAAGNIAVLALARPSLLRARPRWGRRAARGELITLPPLDREQGRTLVRELLPAHGAVPVAAVDRIVERCGGVPLYICELVSALRRAGEGAKASRGALPTDLIEMPSEDGIVAWAVEDELASLSAGARSAAEVLALVGRELSRDEADAACDALHIELDTDVAVGELLHAGLLRTVADRITFRHDLVREAVVHRMNESTRRRVHGVLRTVATDPEELARHAEGSGQRTEAAIAWRAVAHDAQLRHDSLREEYALCRALDCSASPDVELLRRRGSARARIGRHDAAAADFAAAGELARARADRTAAIEVLLDNATALDWALHHEASAERVKEAAEMAAPDDSPHMRARLAMAIGRCAWRSGDSATAVERCREALTLATPLGADGYETAIASRLMLGFILGGRGDVDEAATILDEALTSASSRGDLVHVAAVHCNRYPVHAARGDLTGVRDDLAAFAALGRELGNAVTEYRGELYQTLVEILSDNDARAREHARVAQRLEAADPELFPRPRAALMLAELAARSLAIDEATRWCVIARAHGVSHPSDLLMLDGVTAWIEGELDVATARRLAERAIALDESEAAYELLELAARAASASGDDDTAAHARALARTLPPKLPRFVGASNATLAS